MRANDGSYFVNTQATYSNDCDRGCDCCGGHWLPSGSRRWDGCRCGAWACRRLGRASAASAATRAAITPASATLFGLLGRRTAGVVMLEVFTEVLEIIIEFEA